MTLIYPISYCLPTLSLPIGCCVTITLVNIVSSCFITFKMLHACNISPLVKCFTYKKFNMSVRFLSWTYFYSSRKIAAWQINSDYFDRLLGSRVWFQRIGEKVSFQKISEESALVSPCIAYEATVNLHHKSQYRLHNFLTVRDKTSSR